MWFELYVSAIFPRFHGPRGLAERLGPQDLRSRRRRSGGPSRSSRHARCRRAAGTTARLSAALHGTAPSGASSFMIASVSITTKYGPAVRVPAGGRAGREVPARDAHGRVVLLHGRDGGLIAFERHDLSGITKSQYSANTSPKLFARAQVVVRALLALDLLEREREHTWLSIARGITTTPSASPKMRSPLATFTPAQRPARRLPSRVRGPCCRAARCRRETPGSFIARIALMSRVQPSISAPAAPRTLGGRREQLAPRRDPRRIRAGEHRDFVCRQTVDQRDFQLVRIAARPRGDRPP